MILKKKICRALVIATYAILLGIIIYLSMMLFMPSFTLTSVFNDGKAHLPRTEIEQPISSSSVSDNSNASTETVKVNVNDTQFNAQKAGLNMMGVPAAWNHVKSNKKVTIAVIDTGCRYKLKDLKDNVNTELAYDIYNNCKLVNDPNVPEGDIAGHGTEVCSVISAVANNKYGIAGISYNAEILPIKVADNTEDGDASFYDMEKAYQYLFKLIDSGKLKNLAAINISYSGSYNYSKLQAAINKMHNQYNVVTVAAAGNDGEPWEKTSAEYPSDMDNVLSVEAVGNDSCMAWFSSWNENKDIAAFGDFIPVTCLTEKDDYDLISGTSFASPSVAAIVGLLKTYDPSLSADRIAELLKTTTTPIVKGENDHTGGVDGCTGIVNAKKALNVLISERDNFNKGEFHKLSSSYTYTGKNIKPQVSVYIGSKKLSANDYSLSFKNNKKIGTATVTAKGKGKYAGKKFSETFKIVPKFNSKMTIKKVKGKKHAYTVSWKKYNGVGKVIKYYAKEYDIGFNSNYDLEISSESTKQCKYISELDKGKYTIKVRAKVKYKGETYYTKYIAKSFKAS